MPDDSAAAIEARDLTKHFAGVTAVAGIDFSVRRGELFGFLGPNGAGKTTTINLLTGLARPDRGSIRVAGVDCTRKPKAAQHLMGIVPDESNLYPELTGRQNLCFCGSLYGMRRRDREARARDLLERFGLTHAAERKFGGYSKGMRRKLTIAAGIIHRPAILFLDEPTIGIDVASASPIRQLIAALNRAGTTIFLKSTKSPGGVPADDLRERSGGRPDLSPRQRRASVRPCTSAKTLSEVQAHKVPSRGLAGTQSHRGCPSQVGP